MTATGRSKMRCQEGFTLLEVLLSLALIGITVAGILSAMSTSSRATLTNEVQTTAQNLAEGQMEYVRSQQYDSANNPPQYQVLASVPTGYSVNCVAVRLDPDEDGSDDDDGLQRITVTVDYHDITATSIEAYRVK